MSEDGFRDSPPPPPASPPISDDPPPPPADESVRYRLRFGSIMVPAKGGMREVDEIVCRRPNGADMLAIGNPVKFFPTTGEVDHNVDRMPPMIFRLSGVTPASLAKMDTRDLTGLFWSVTHFFLPTPGAV